MMPVVKLFTFFDANPSGEVVLPYVAEEKNFFSTAIKTFESWIQIINHNIFIEKDLLLSSGVISLFSYSSLIISAFLILHLIYNLIIKNKTPSNNHYIYLLAFYSLFYFVFLIFSHNEGLREGWKYSVNFFICEIIVTYYGISLVIKKIKQRYLVIRKRSDIMLSCSIIFFLIMAFLSSDMLSFGFMIPRSPEYSHMIILNKNVDLDRSCYIIKIHPDQPQIDYYYGLQKNAVYFGEPPGFYEALGNYDKKAKCFYYQYVDLSEDDILDNRKQLDNQKIDKLFSNCKKEGVFHFNNSKNQEYDSKAFSLFKYLC